MNAHDILSMLLSAVSVVAVGALAKVLASSQVTNLVNSLASKGAAETEKLLAEADATHNGLLILAIHAAMTYAENHSSEVLKDFDTKADYVIESIDADPRFAHLNLPLDAVKHLVEQLFQQYFSALPHSTPAPADVTGGGPGKP